MRVIKRILLRGDLGFHGVVISDSLGSTAVAVHDFLVIAPSTSLNAGGDMIVINQLDQAIAMVQAVQSLAAERDWFRDRIENATWHVLRAGSSPACSTAAEFAA